MNQISKIDIKNQKIKISEMKNLIESLNTTIKALDIDNSVYLENHRIQDKVYLCNDRGRIATLNLVELTFNALNQNYKFKHSELSVVVLTFDAIKELYRYAPGLMDIKIDEPFETEPKLGIYEDEKGEN